MKEELFVSGRNIPHIDPFLHLWTWEIPLYLFLGGLSAGILFFAGYFYVMHKERDMTATIKWAPMLVPFLLVIGLGALFLDLHHKLYFWRLYTIIRLESPMSWGAWVLMAITPLSIIWAATYLKEVFPKWKWPFAWLDSFEAFAIKQRKAMAWAMMLLSVILGVYTGILLSAFNARPLWNTSILGPLFLVSGFSTGLAAIVWMSKSKYERKVLTRIDLIFIFVELFFIIHMIMGLQAGSEAAIEASQLFLGGQFTVTFWVFVVLLGLLFPATLEILELRGYHVPGWLPSFLILLGGLIFRFVMMDAGQLTRYLY